MIFRKKQSDVPRLRFSAEDNGSGGFRVKIDVQGPTATLLDMAAALAAEIINKIPQDEHAAACRFFGESVTSALEHLKQQTEERLQ